MTWPALGLPALLAAIVAWQLGALLTAADEGRGGRLPALAGAIALALAVTVGLFVAPLAGAATQPEVLPVVVLAATLVLLAGLWRDLGRGFRGLAFLQLLVAALLVVYLGHVSIGVIKRPFSGPLNPFIDLGAAGPVLTVIWIVAVGVVVRFMDPLPGFTAGFGAIAAATFLAVALLRGGDANAAIGPLAPTLSAVILGACLGLVTPGMGPRALALGRGGAVMLGFLLGVLTVVGTLKHTAFLLLGLPVLALAVPVLNVAYLQRQWARAGRADPARLDRARTLGDMLLRRGFTHRRTTGLLLALQAYCSLVALVLVGGATLHWALKGLVLLTLLPVAFVAFFLISRIAARLAVTSDQRVTLLGVPVDPLTYDTAIARMDGFIAANTPHHVFTADVSGIMRCQEDGELRAIVETCDLVTADGAGVLWAARLFDFPLPERVSGVDLVRRLSALAAERGYRIFLLGAAPGVAEAAGAKLVAEHPGLNLVGIRDGYFQDEQEVAEAIRAAAPQILFVALGIPRQEQFIRRWYQELNLPLCLGIGGSFDVISGNLERAPEWMQRAGLEWLFRVIQEPKRLPRLAALPKFLSAIAWQSWRAWWRGEAPTADPAAPGSAATP